MIYGFARRWAAAGVIGVIRDQLCRKVRLASGKTPRAASAIVDSQSIKASETVGKATRRWDGGKLINGRKRHLISDNSGLVLLVMVTDAAAQVSLVARELLFRLALDRSPSAGRQGPRRWVVERSWSWIMRARRHCRDYERLPEMSESLITWAAITLMTRRLTRRSSRPATQVTTWTPVAQAA
ncbi:transposase [Streptomyces ferrugineus]|uniref:Transposase n=1 Tax=Streptomyces ferrugineus TaxID=1413221 RepID=A0A7M2SZ34_9ACTN|nr:transposase [Streptomyces ferrugineus]